MPIEVLFRPLAFVVNALAFWRLVRHVIYAPRLRFSESTRFALLTLLSAIDLCALLWMDCHLRTVAYWVLIVAVSARSVTAVSLENIGTALGKSQFVVFVLSVLTVSLLVYVHLPVTAFLTSPGEIGLHLDYLARQSLRDAMVVVYVAIYAYAALPAKPVKTSLAVGALVSAAVAIVYSFALPFGYPPMSGVMFEQIPIPVSSLVGRVVVDLGTVGAVALGMVFVVQRFGGARIATVAVLLNLAFTISSGISVAGDTGAGPERLDDAEAEQPIRLARGQPNVLILFLDRFMGGFVERILASDPSLATRLSGFEWYPNTVAAGENSISGVHPIFGGYDYLPREMNRRGRPLRDLSVEAYRLLPHNFAAAGYEVNVVNPRGLGFTMRGDCAFLTMANVRCSHVSASLVADHVADAGIPNESLAESSYADLLVMLGAMRSTPYALKAVLHQRGPWQQFMDHSAGTTLREWAELKSLPELTSLTATRSAMNVFWSILPHEPYFLGEDCRPKRTPLTRPDHEWRAEGYESLFAFQHEVAAGCSLALVADYLDWLKLQQVYDNTTIVIVSDHGIVGPVSDRSSRAVRGGTTDNLYVRSRSVLFVKSIGADGPLRVSENFTPNAEVPRIVCAQIGGCTNPFLDNRQVAAHGRDNPFVVSFVPWQFNLQRPDGFVMLHELQVDNRDVYDIRNWQEAAGR